MYIQYDGCNIEKMNQRYAVEITTNGGLIFETAIQPFGMLLKDASQFPIVSIQNVSGAEVTMTWEWGGLDELGEWVSLYGFGKLINDCLLFECGYSPNIVESVFKISPIDSIKRILVEDLGEVENNRNMLTDAITLVNTRLSYLPNLINLIDLSYFVIPLEGAKYTSNIQKRCQPYFDFGGNLLTGKKWWAFYWKEYCESLWDKVKQNMCISDSRKIIFKTEPLNERVPYYKHTDKQFNDLRSFIDWYITFRYNI